MENNKKLKIGLRIILATSLFSILLTLASLSPHTEAIVSYPPAALLQPGDITTNLIKDGAITSSKIATSADVATNATVTTAIYNATTSLLQEVNSGSVTATGVAAETLTAGDAVVSSNETSTIFQGDSTNNNSFSNTGWIAGITTTTVNTTKINSIQLYVDSTVSDVLTVSLRNVAGTIPTGTDLVVATTTIATTSAVFKTFTFNYAVPTSTAYAIVLRRASAAGSATVYRTNGAGAGLSTSANSGATWTPAAFTLYAVVDLTTDTTTPMIRRASAAGSANFRSDNFIGFANGTTATGTQATITIDGIKTGFAGLTPGTTYYLSNTNGGISTATGSTTRKIGVSLGNSKILIKHDNP